MARRTGLPTLDKVARTMCRLITQFTPYIRQLFPNNVALLAALEAANAACDVLVAEIQAVTELGD